MSISCLLLACLLLASLTSCMKIGMRQNSIESRLKEAGASISYEKTTPVTDGTKGIFGDFILAQKSFTHSIDSQDIETVQYLYVIFCNDDKSADMAESLCKEYVSKYSTDNFSERTEISDSADLPKLNDTFDNPSDTPKLYKWVAYRYDRVVMCGYYEVVAIARNY